MARQSDGDLIFVIGGGVLGLITGVIFFFVKNSWLSSIFGYGYYSFLLAFALSMFAFAVLGVLIGWLFTFLRS